MNGGAGGVFNSTNVVLAVLPSDPTSACSRQANGGAAVAVGGGLTFHESNGFFLSRKCISRYIFHVPSWKLGHIRIHAIHAVQTVIVVDDYYDPGVLLCWMLSTHRFREEHVDLFDLQPSRHSRFADGMTKFASIDYSSHRSCQTDIEDMLFGTVEK